MKWRYRLAEIKRNQKRLMDFLENYSFDNGKAHDSPKILSMDQKLGIAGELQRFQMIRKKIEKMNHLELQDTSDHYSIKISSSMNGGQNCSVRTSLKNKHINGARTPLPKIPRTWGRTQ